MILCPFQITWNICLIYMKLFSHTMSKLKYESEYFEQMFILSIKFSKQRRRVIRLDCNIYNEVDQMFFVYSEPSLKTKVHSWLGLTTRSL
jgi:hypothetical protein